MMMMRLVKDAAKIEIDGWYTGAGQCDEREWLRGSDYHCQSRTQYWDTIMAVRQNNMSEKLL